MTAGSVASSSALCTLTIAQSTLDEDLLLQLVLKLASPFQVKVKTTSTSSVPTQLQLGPHAHDNLVCQRNAILRALCGMGLHCALDNNTNSNHKCKLLGGHGTTARCSLVSRLSLASLTEWMALADELRCCSTSTSAAAAAASSSTETILARLEEHLTAHAYLIPSPQATLADFDVALELLLTRNNKINNKELDTSAYYPNVSRWLRQCYAEMQAHGLEALLTTTTSLLTPPPLVAPVLPIFFDGTEQETAPFSTTKAKPATAAAPFKKADGDSDKQQQQQHPVHHHRHQKEKKENQHHHHHHHHHHHKAEKKEQQEQPTKDTKTAPFTEYNISALDIRVGKIVQVWHHETADKLFCEVIDLGTEQRQIASGLRPFYQLQDLQDRLVLVLCNLKARNLVGFPSHGMVLCASNADHSSVEFVVPPPGSQVGERVVFEGYHDEQQQQQQLQPEPETKMAKKKILEALAPDLQTDAQGRVVWKGAVAKTSRGEVKALNGMPHARVS